MVGQKRAVGVLGRMMREAHELSKARKLPQVRKQLGIGSNQRAVGFVDCKKMLVESPVDRPIGADPVSNDVRSAFGN